MSGWVKKRFWSEVAVCSTEGGYTVTLDGRALRTPAKSPLVVPTEALAALLAEEWRAQGDVIAPDAMPATRAANAAIDKVRGQQAEVAGLLAAYGDSDLVCYRAEAPEVLVALEAQAWDPLLDWAELRYGCRPLTRSGVMHAPQPRVLLETLRADISRLGVFELTAFHDLVAMSGSLIIGLAVLDRYAPPERLWEASRVDEEWQAAQWGEDEEAAALSSGRRAAFLDAARFYFALRA